jgi:DNA-binding beta-propeller fold protein YncE
VGAVAAVLSGCSAFATPQPGPLPRASLAPAGTLGYVACPTAVTPVELATHTPEASIPLPISGTPVLGNFAIAASPDGRWAYVVTSDGAVSSQQPAAVTSSSLSSTDGGLAPPAGAQVQNVVVPIDLTAQRAELPIAIPGQGGTHAIVVLPGGRSVLAASGSTIVPVDAVTRQVGRPLQLGPGNTIFGMALNPKATTLYALVAGGVFPVDTARGTVGAEIPTGLSVSSVYSPHGIAVTADGSTVYVVGQGAPSFGGRVLPIVTATGSAGAATGFDAFGIADPAALAVVPDGTSLLVVDSANNWVNPVVVATFANPPQPVRLPEQRSGTSLSGTRHPTDIVLGPGQTGAFIVDDFDSVIPYRPGSQTFGRPIPVCPGASSMTVARAP